MQPVQLLTAGPGQPVHTPALRTKVQEVRDHPQELGWSLAAVPAELDGLLSSAPEARAALIRAMEKLDLSARSHYRLIRLARTIAHSIAPTFHSPYMKESPLSPSFQGGLKQASPG